MSTEPRMGSVSALQLLSAEYEAKASRLHAHVAEAVELFHKVADAVAQTATRTLDSVTRSELTEQPALDLSALAASLDAHGPTGLTMRQRKALITAPSLMTQGRLTALLADAPQLAQTMARFALRVWPRFVEENWGELYAQALIAHDQHVRLPIVKERVLTPARLWSRQVGHVENALVKRCRETGLSQTHAKLRQQFGLRDSWLLTPLVLLAWLRVQDDGQLEPEVVELMREPHLRAMLLPGERVLGKPGPPVARDIGVHSQTVAFLMRAGFSAAAPIGPQVRDQLVAYLLESEFGDPRTASLSEGWLNVRELELSAFKQMLSALCEQDLEIFFAYAMNEPERKRFWLRYLHAIERTGCLMSADRKKALRARLGKRPELAHALARAYAYRRAAAVQAFYLVFRDHVVVEFSDTGNAAYVYKRRGFEKTFERAIQRGQVDNEAQLKRGKDLVDRIIHQPGWQKAADTRLAELGYHGRGR